MEPESSQIPMINPYLIQQQQAQQQMLLQQQILLQQQQQQQLLHQQMPPLAQQSISMPQPQMIMQQPLYDINAFTGRSSSANISPIPETTVQSPKSPLSKASKEFYALFRNGGKSYVQCPR